MERRENVVKLSSASKTRFSFMLSVVPLLKTNIYISNFLVLLSKDPSVSVAWQ